MSVGEDMMEDIKVDTFEGLEDLAGGDEKLQELLKNIIEGTKTAATRPQQQLMSIHWAVYLLAFFIIFGTIGLFSYKLVQSLKEKERKREEKRKLKEMKKKK